MYFDRFDICEAYLALEWDYSIGGYLQERQARQPKGKTVYSQLKDIGFKPSPLFMGFRSLTENGKEIYLNRAKSLGLLRADLYNFNPDVEDLDF